MSDRSVNVGGNCVGNTIVTGDKVKFNGNFNVEKTDDELQESIALWCKKNFGLEGIDQLLGLVEEVSELGECFLNINEEKWVPVKGFEDFYEVSDFGNIKRIKEGQGAVKGKMLKPSINKDGYAEVNLFKGNLESKTLKGVHRIVAESWLGECPDGFEVNHKDLNTENNCVWNLEYLSHQDNCRYTYSVSVRPSKKFTKDDIEKIKLDERSNNKIAKDYKTDGGTISRIKNGKIYATLGYEEDFKKLLQIQNMLGKLTHSYLKRKQGIRGSAEEHKKAIEDAVGDIQVYLANFCTTEGISMRGALKKTWHETVSKRDWTINKQNGQV